MVLSSYGKHVLDFWLRRNDVNILFLKYEDMKRDLTAVARRVAEFLGKSDISKDRLAAIVDECSFASMKKNPSTNKEYLKDIGIMKKDSVFLRKGKIYL